MKERILSLQALRFLAATSVVGYHSWCEADSALHGRCAVVNSLAMGTAGVDIFFVLSGLVITLTGPLASPRPTAGQFFWRRWSRVAPIFYLLSLPLILLAARNGTLSWPRTAATFLFWPAAGPRIASPYLGVGWTLCFEMLFYSAVSLTLIGGRLGRNVLLLVAAVAALAIARQFSDWNPLRILANPVFLEFAAGAGLAWAWPQLRRAPLAAGGACLAVGLAIFAIEAVVGVGDAIQVAPTLEDTHAWWRVAVFGPPAVLVVAGAAICDRAARGAVLSVLSRLGDASYSIYLVQDLCLPLLTVAGVVLLAAGGPVPIALLNVAGIIAVGVASYSRLERPMLAWLRRVGRTAGAAPLAPTGATP